MGEKSILSLSFVYCTWSEMVVGKDYYYLNMYTIAATEIAKWVIAKESTKEMKWNLKIFT